MAERYSQYPDSNPDRDRERHDRDRYGRDERGVADRAGDEVRSWFGDDEAAARRRRDEVWGRERSYSSDRAYGDRDYGWRDRPQPDWRTPASRDYAAAFGPEARRVDEYGRDTYGGPYARERFGAREWSSTERWRVPGPFVGRGPRGYQRSDDRIREEINDRLTAHGLLDATDVECRVQSGEVVLTGFVDSREAKRAAEDVAEDVTGVREVHNQLRVRSHAADAPGVGRTSVLGLTEHQVQTPANAPPADTSRSRRS